MVFACSPASRTGAQVFTPLHAFTGGDDGGSPNAGLVLLDNMLYGTTEFGGDADIGAVFGIATDGGGFTNLHSFSATTHGVNYDGTIPEDALTLSADTLYATASYGGTNGNGNVFQIGLENDIFTPIYNFTGDLAGQNPVGGVVLSGNTLYGTTYYGGGAAGLIYAVNTDGSGYTDLHSFSAPAGPSGTNSHGLNPADTLVLSGNTLYGTAIAGGVAGDGTVFKYNIGTGVFTTLHSFTNGTDGASPQAGLLLAGGLLYGTTVSGGRAGFGAVYAVDTNGVNFTTLYSFTNGTDGEYPYAGLALSGGILYGTTTGAGSIFRLSTNGSDFTTLYHFTNGLDGSYPKGVLIVSGNTLYGTARNDGEYNSGTVFSFSLVPPQLSIQLAGTNVILTWVTNATAFALQFATNLIPLSNWSAVTNAPVVVSGLNTVTNPITASQIFYRLSE
jgi:uncharacterized repeat protein (TIGR03803 family)